jgi:hypothetical protein
MSAGRERDAVEGCSWGGGLYVVGRVWTVRWVEMMISICRAGAAGLGELGKRDYVGSFEYTRTWAGSVDWIRWLLC